GMTQITRALGRIRELLPRGNSLPPDAWQARHRVLAALILAHVPAIFVFGILRGFGFSHSAFEASLLVVAGTAAFSLRLSPTVREITATLGLMASSAILTHMAAGSIEMHFHFFVALGLISLYQNWRSFLLALAFVVLHHGVMGVIEPTSVYNHAAAWNHPWRWAALHGGFILGACAVSIAAWRFTEMAQEKLASATNQLADAASKLEHQAFHDSLTGLANRALFWDRVEHALSRSARGSAAVAVLFIDLDDFKLVNDTLGHAAGDIVLVEASRRLSDSLRPSDTIARLGGDEFAILLEDIVGEKSAVEVAQRIVNEMEMPIDIDAREVLIHASVGIAMGTGGIDSAQDLARRADLAMYAAKARGKGRFDLYEPTMQDAMAGKLDLAAALTHAIERGELQVHYQPIVDLRNGRIRSVEALVRWTHPERGTISPGDFIPIAEETGLIRQIDDFVLGQACYTLRQWQTRFGDRAPNDVKVNLSARSLRQPDVMNRVGAVLEREGLPPQALTVEITESVLVDGSETQSLIDLKNMGVRLAVDDFGTGYSSLSYLRRFPVDILKIDRAFVAPLSDPLQDDALTQAMVKIGDSLNLQVVAEGVETHVQLSKLRRMGCVYAQGFLFSPPLPDTELEQLFEPWQIDSPREAEIRHTQELVAAV
ncbi:MAG TPA: EAL domain-containing protein, partial [Actinomycetota bacterium]|nr:EAL domain-containing protein [Actinomycetota bacterium]